MNETYAAPQSSLMAPTETEGGSLEGALAGNYSINLSDIMSEAWQKTKGVKRYILGAGLIMYLVMFAAASALGLFSAFAPEGGVASFVIQVVVQVLIMAIWLPFAAGIFVISARKVLEKPFEFNDAFSGFGKTVPLIVAGILMNILVTLGFLLLVIPGIYLSFAYMMTIPLMVDRGMGPWEALETSRKALTKHWFSFFVFWIVMMLILIVSMLPLGLGLIWTVPMLSLAFAIIYRDVFGVETL